MKRKRTAAQEPKCAEDALPGLAADDLAVGNADHLMEWLDKQMSIGSDAPTGVPNAVPDEANMHADGRQDRDADDSSDDDDMCYSDGEAPRDVCNGDGNDSDDDDDDNDARVAALMAESVCGLDKNGRLEDRTLETESVYGNPYRHPQATMVESRPDVHVVGTPPWWHFERFVNSTVVDGPTLEKLSSEVDRPMRLALAAGIVHARGLTRHQVEGFDKFMDVYLPAIVAENRYVVVDAETVRRRHVLEFGAITVHKPSMREADGTVRPVYPRECRMRGLVYGCTVTCRLQYTAFDISGLTKDQLKARGQDCAGLPLCRTVVSHEHILCQIPCMIGSRYCRLRGSPSLMGECPLERPGTFVVRGSVKMLVSQIKMRINHACVMLDRARVKYSHICEIRPRHESKIRSTSTLYMYLAVARPHIDVRMPFIKERVPIAAVFRLLGVERRQDMVAAVLDHMSPLNPESDAHMERLVQRVFDQDDKAEYSRQALCEWIGTVGTRGSTDREALASGSGGGGGGAPGAAGEPTRRPVTREERIRFAEHIMGNEFLPHVGLDRSRETYLRKAHHLGYCVHKLLAVSLGRLPLDNRDHMGLKRIDTAAVLLPTLFRPLFHSLRKGASTHMKKRSTYRNEIAVANILDHRRVTTILRSAFMTGNWSVQKGTTAAATGVAQVHNRMTVTSSLSNLRRLSMPINKEGKLAKVRQLRPDSAGMICFIETPEGGGCGLVTNLALGAHVRVGHDREHAVAFVRRAALFCARIRATADRIDGMTFEDEAQKGLLLRLALEALRNGRDTDKDDDDGDDDDGGDDISNGASDKGKEKDRETKAAAAATAAAGRRLIVTKDAAGRPLRGLLGVLETTQRQKRTLTQVLVNGVPEGYVEDGIALAKALRDMRRLFALPFDTSIVHRPAQRLLEVHVDTGCCLRPLLRVDGLHRVRPLLKQFGSGLPPEMLFQQLLIEGVIEYMSKDEEDTCRVAIDPADLVDPRHHTVGLARDGVTALDPEPFTHVEVHPLLLMGVCASIIPFCEHNQAPRNIYQAAMGKQSKAIVCLNADHTIDTVSHSLCYPQVPLVQTVMEDIIGATRLPMGQNVRVAIMSDAYNQEDSMVIKKEFVERGGFRSMIKRVCRDDAKVKGADATHFCRPQDEGCHGMRKANYAKLGPDGYVEPGVRVVPGDVLIGKVCNTDEMRDPDAGRMVGGSGGGASGSGGQMACIVKRDKSTILRTNEPATIQRVIVTRNSEGAPALKIVTVAARQPEVGDKLSSRHGQKGTVGFVRSACDMPWSHIDGSIPDIIINPHAIPSRMTLGMIIEALLGKVAARDGFIGDGTPFGGPTINDVGEMLVKHGCQRYGKELMYNPTTGLPMKAMIFVAPVYYQSLRHVAIDKIHARPRGPVQMLTRQPVEGRSRAGGFRLGTSIRTFLLPYPSPTRTH